MSVTTSRPEPRSSGYTSPIELVVVLLLADVSAEGSAGLRMTERPIDADNTVPLRGFHDDSNPPDV